MAKSRESFDRRTRERNKKAKADAKREARLTKGGEEGDDVEGAEGGAPATAARDDAPILRALADLHAAFDDEKISFDDFEEQRAELLARLTID